MNYARLADYEAQTNEEVMRRYRFDRNGIDQLHALMGDELAPNTLGDRNLLSIEKILISLRYFASGCIQLNDGDIHHISQSSVSRAVTQVVGILSRPEITTQHILFPLSPREVNMAKQDFFGIANFPNVVGLIDGTQIQLQAPWEQEEAYINRMRYHSINTQLVFDGQDKITDIVARWPGSTHDSRILRESGVAQLFEQGHVHGEHVYMLGDSGYPCKRWLLTPFLNPTPGSQTEYNRAHKKTRAKVERAIGQFKRRWGILHGEIRLKPEKVCQVIMSCGVLHNMCKDMGIPMIDEHGDEQGQQNVVYRGAQNGLQYRNFIADSFF